MWRLPGNRVSKTQFISQPFTKQVKCFKPASSASLHTCSALFIMIDISLSLVLSLSVKPPWPTVGSSQVPIRLLGSRVFGPRGRQRCPMSSTLSHVFVAWSLPSMNRTSKTCSRSPWAGIGSTQTGSSNASPTSKPRAICSRTWSITIKSTAKSCWQFEASTWPKRAITRLSWIIGWGSKCLTTGTYTTSFWSQRCGYWMMGFRVFIFLIWIFGGCWGWIWLDLCWIVGLMLGFVG